LVPQELGGRLVYKALKLENRIINNEYQYLESRLLEQVKAEASGLIHRTFLSCFLPGLLPSFCCHYFFRLQYIFNALDKRIRIKGNTIDALLNQEAGESG
jgi:hypothetical protein